MNEKLIHIDCFCGQAVGAMLAVNTTGQVTCPGCEFVWTVSRVREGDRVRQTIRPKKTGKNPIVFKVGGEEVPVAARTELA